jgi:hypothetical protein
MIDVVNEPVDLFVSYAPADERLWMEFKKHISMLERSGVVRTWGAHSTHAGEDWRSAVLARLSSAHVIVLLLSADFFASDQCYDVEVEKALTLVRQGKTHVIPIRVRAYDWGAVPFARLRALPSNGLPVTSWATPDDAWAEAAREIRLAIAAVADARSHPALVSSVVGESVLGTRSPDGTAELDGPCGRARAEEGSSTADAPVIANESDLVGATAYRVGRTFAESLRRGRSQK